MPQVAEERQWIWEMLLAVVKARQPQSSLLGENAYVEVWIKVSLPDRIGIMCCASR
jgi:hypothetical protein